MNSKTDQKAFEKMCVETAENSKRTDKTCFSQCDWLEAMIRCKNCPYIIVQGGNVEIIDARVKGRYNIFEKAEKTTVQEWTLK